MTRAILILSRNRVAKCGISRQQQSAFECAYNLQVFCFKVYPDGCVWYASRFLLLLPPLCPNVFMIIVVMAAVVTCYGIGFRTGYFFFLLEERLQKKHTRSRAFQSFLSLARFLLLLLMFVTSGSKLICNTSTTMNAHVAQVK